ncbi:MAG: VWA domain-containing protein, partial [Verrucomicrobia bacterium]|nr:VWA domain-containing protein [Verrucomicrobiota bacterium]
MTVQFTEPLWLLALVPAVAWVLWLARTSLAEGGPVRRWLALGLRLSTVVAVVLALAGVQWRHRVDGMNVVFLLDVSQSVPTGQQAAAREQVRSFVREKPAGDRAGLVVFGTEAALEAQPSTALEVAPSGSVVVPEGRTDLAAALRLAMAAMPETGQRRLVVFSDGGENLGDALQVAASAKGLETVVDVAPMGGGRPQDVSVERLQLPSRVPEGTPFEVKVVVEASQAGPVRVDLYRDDQALGTQTITLTAGRNLLTFPQTLVEPGFHSYDLRVDSPEDGIPQNNRAAGFTVVAGRPSLLVVSQDPAADAPLVEALRDTGTAVQVVRPAQFPDTLAALQSHECVILSNVSATDLGRDPQQRLQSAVRDFGVGLVCIGGDQAFAAGGYRGTPLDEILPVESDLSSRKVLPSGALVLVIDRSGSMEGEKLDMAKEAAMAAADLLTGHDFLGVVAFDGAPSEVLPMGKAGRGREAASAIGRIGLGGGTVMGPALERAHQMLRGVSASLKHVVVLTDGQSQPADFEGMARTMAGERITISTVALGSDCDLALLQRMAMEGRGRFYHVPRPGTLPQIFLQETAVILKTAIHEEPFQPQVVSATEPIRGFGRGFPMLQGHVVTMPRPRAELALATGQGDPLLAHWQYGLGRV